MLQTPFHISRQKTFISEPLQLSPNPRAIDSRAQQNPQSRFRDYSSGGQAKGGSSRVGLFSREIERFRWDLFECQTEFRSTQWLDFGNRGEPEQGGRNRRIWFWPAAKTTLSSCGAPAMDSSTRRVSAFWRRICRTTLGTFRFPVGLRTSFWFSTRTGKSFYTTRSKIDPLWIDSEWPRTRSSFSITSSMISSWYFTKTRCRFTRATEISSTSSSSTLFSTSQDVSRFSIWFSWVSEWVD